MDPFTTLKAVAAPLDLSDVDTDRIIPARFLTKPKSDGLGQYAFHDIRFESDGSEKPDFPLNQAPFRAAQILVADANFGCGSSRESAVWAVAGLGIRSIIAPSFGDIFYNNCTKNGLLPVRLPGEVVAAMRATLRQQPGLEIAIDLAAQSVVGPDGVVHAFEIDPFAKQSLLKGIDDIDLTLQFEEQIAQFERRWQTDSPWATPRRSV
jgi:3-isopropylmalate/(R)-2-methylmalate dehydratase small subunit